MEDNKLTPEYINFVCISCNRLWTMPGRIIDGLFTFYHPFPDKCPHCGNRTMNNEEYQQLLKNISAKFNQRPINTKKTTPKIKVKSLPIVSIYKSNLEKQYANYLESLRLTSAVLSWRYEPVGLRLAKNTYYHPDFMVVTPEGLIEFHETKGFVRQTGRAKWKIAAELFPEFTFKWVTKKDKSWKIVEYGNKQ